MDKEKSKRSQNDQVHFILDLAVNCKLLTPEKEKQVLPEVIVYFKKKPEASLARYLVARNILSKDNVRFLYAVKKHLDTLMADRKFGRLGVANNFVTEEKVKQALDLQVEIFKTRKKSIRIGDILVQNNHISVADKTALLLTQDRIKDELLADALNAIAKNEMDQIEINKRFGAVAVKKKLVTTDQLNRALKIQKTESDNGQEKRTLADIFKTEYDLTDDDILSILKVQRTLETRRMNLEENLKAYHLEKTASQTLDPFFEYHVTEDRMKAVVWKTKKTEDQPSAKAFINWLALSGIVYGLCDMARINAFLSLNEVGVQLEVALGKKSVPFQKESAEFLFDMPMNDDSGVANTKTDGLVDEGDVLAKITPHREAVPGTDVFGRSIHSPDGPVSLLRAGHGVAKRGSRFVAKIKGYPQVFKNRTVFITPVLDEYETQQIEGNITRSSHADYPACNLNIKGSILKGVQLVCHHLVIDGDILGNVTATGNIEVRGNIGDRAVEKLRETPACMVEAKGQVRVSQTITNAIIIAGKGLLAANSDLVCSRVSASGDIVMNNIYSSRQAPSILKVTRENVIEVEKMSRKIKALSAGLANLTHKTELDDLSKALMEQIQVQNGYLEKQNVTLYLSRMLNDPQIQTMKTASIQERHAAYQTAGRQDDENRIVIPEQTKAYRFMTMIMDRIQPLKADEQSQYVKELNESISTLYKTSVKATDRMTKAYDARSKVIEDHVADTKPHIEKLESKISAFQNKKDMLLHQIDQSQAKERPVIKVRNQVDAKTIILGETARMVIEKAIHGVVFKENPDDRTMGVEGLFE